MSEQTGWKLHFDRTWKAWAFGFGLMVEHGYVDGYVSFGPLSLHVTREVVE